MNSTPAPTAIIADDEPLLRERLRSLLATAWPALSIVGEARNGREAVELGATLEPDIAFLDIKMPLITGIDAARMLPRDIRTVFVTAYDEYAVRAFETGAADYLVKPIEPKRLDQTVVRLQEHIALRHDRTADVGSLLARLSQHVRPDQSPYLEWIRASVGQKVKLIAVNDVLFFQSDEKYTRVVTANAGEVLIRKSIRELLDELDPQRFAQVHRATIVNLRAVEHVERSDADWLALNIRGSKESLRVSRNFVHLFRQM
jgi:DNA-binding LytR/AlgR family response regulator